MTCPEISPDVKNYPSISVEKIVLKNPKLTVNLLNNQKDYSVEYLLWLSFDLIRRIFI